MPRKKTPTPPPLVESLQEQVESLQEQVQPKATSHKRPLPYRIAIFVACLAGLIYLLSFAPTEQREVLWRALTLQRNLIVPMLVLGLLALSLLWARGQEIDNRVFLFFNLRGRRPRWLDIALGTFSQLGNGALAIGLSLYLMRSNPSLSGQLALGVLSLSIMVELLKALTDRARPFITNPKARVVGWREPGRSFPSGHTSQIFFLATLLYHHFEPGLGIGILLYAVAALVGFTRMYVGAHYPRDVIGGALLGLMWGTLANLIDPYWVPLFTWLG
ncbi:MAG TPA: phosphatase PAP2 family protein [Anaerolineales bacterium]|nr:phosphatase PAP2 family protein [Anaerolineales bacterium]HRQ92126.1 phosphatase PAP2 family protein [Anaerolineales bacterium]